jgi:hypothetical protein
MTASGLICEIAVFLRQKDMVLPVLNKIGREESILKSNILFLLVGPQLAFGGIFFFKRKWVEIILRHALKVSIMLF